MGRVQGKLDLRVGPAVLEMSKDEGATWAAAAGNPMGWIGERAAVAVTRIPTLNRFHGSDLLDGEFFLSAANTPTQVATETGGVFKVPSGAAATGYLSLGKTDSQVLIAAPKTESWYAASRCKIPSAGSVSAAKTVIPLGLYQAGHFTYLQWVQTVSATILQLNFNNGSDNRTALGAAGTIGSGIPVGTYFVLAMHFNSVSGAFTIEINDTVVFTASGSGLANMSTQAGSLIIQSDDLTFSLYADAVFMACGAPL